MTDNDLSEWAVEPLIRTRNEFEPGSNVGFRSRYCVVLLSRGRISYMVVSFRPVMCVSSDSIGRVGEDRPTRGEDLCRT